MKKNAPKHFNKQQDTFKLFGINTNTMIKRFLLLLFGLYCVNISAQDTNLNNETPQVMEVKTFISSLKKANGNSRNSIPKSTNVENLLYNVQPAIYFNSGDVKTYGEKPKKFFIDFQYLNQIRSSNLLKNNIEIVTIKINSLNELNSTIDLSLFSSFKNLKYIYIISNVTTTEQAILGMIRNYNEKYSIFYNIEKGEGNH